MRSEPFAETFGLPVLLAVATSDGRISLIAFFASSVSFAMVTSLVTRSDLCQKYHFTLMVLSSQGAAATIANLTEGPIMQEE
jgi:hypothetical protein